MSGYLTFWCAIEARAIGSNKLVSILESRARESSSYYRFSWLRITTLAPRSWFLIGLRFHWWFPCLWSPLIKWLHTLRSELCLSLLDYYANGLMFAVSVMTYYREHLSAKNGAPYNEEDSAEGGCRPEEGWDSCSCVSLGHIDGSVRFVYIFSPIFQQFCICSLSSSSTGDRKMRKGLITRGLRVWDRICEDSAMLHLVSRSATENDV